MGKTIKEIADEIGVSKQAVYKRVTGKLSSVCAPHIYTEYNAMLLDEDGEAIVKKDFEKKPCATPLFRNTYGANQNNSPAPQPEYIQNTNNSYGTLPSSYSEYFAVNTPAPNNTPYQSGVYNTEQVRNTNTPLQSVSNNIPKTAPINIENTAEHSGTNVEQSVADTEYIRKLYETDPNILRMQLEESKDKNHETELELVKANAEKDKLEEIITQLQHRLDDKDKQIAEQKLMIEKTDNERKLLTASLFKNNELLSKLLQLPLSKRVFGWKDVQKQLMTTQDDIIGESDIIDSTFD